MLSRALESLARQTFDDFETIVVMDECWAFTRSHVDAYAGVLNLSVFERHKKEGLAFAKNFGIAKSNRDWIAYLDADDTWMDCKLEVQRNYMIANPDIDFCGTESWDRDPATDIITPNCFAIGQYESHIEIAKRLPRENVMCHGSMMVRRTAVQALNGYSTERRVLGFEDWDLWARAINSNYIFGKVPERLYVWSAGTSVSR